MKELNRFREFLNENKKDTLRSLIQDLTTMEYEAFAKDVGIDLEDGAEMREFVASISDQQADSLIQSINFGKYGYKAMGAFNEDKNEEYPLLGFINPIGQALQGMSKEDASDNIDRLMDYLKDKKADIEYKNK